MRLSWWVHWDRDACKRREQHEHVTDVSCDNHTLHPIQPIALQVAHIEDSRVLQLAYVGRKKGQITLLHHLHGR